MLCQNGSEKSKKGITINFVCGWSAGIWPEARLSMPGFEDCFPVILPCYNWPVDRLDNRLIAELATDARQSNIELSKRLGVSEKTVRRRIARLVEQGVINWSVIPDPSKLGYTVRAFILLEVEAPHVDDITQSLAGCANVDFIALCTGPFDILFGAWFASSASMAKFLKDYLPKITGVRKSQTHVALQVTTGKIANLATLMESSEG
jgi:Lrp/AsnC family transcriptional regulator, regulator for asnA, asnC and gidA